MLSKWPIRNKLLIGLAIFLVMVSTLSWSAFYGLYAYRSLLKSLERVSELRLATELSQRVSDLRACHSRLMAVAELPISVRMERDEFSQHIANVSYVLESYRKEITRNDHIKTRIGTSQREQQTVARMESALTRIEKHHPGADPLTDDVQVGQLNRDLESLHQLAGELPGHLHQSIHDFVDEARDTRRTLIVVAWATSVVTAVMLVSIVRLFYVWVFRPLRVLVKGSRKVAQGNFDYRIRLSSCDEMSELAEAMNDMTDRFQAIQNDLERQVQERTRQVVRSEQLASVGFLAAGVAHEINNPLQAVAVCAESLEGRMQALIGPEHPDYALVVSYVQMIQQEAFRCKEITGKLLDYSRSGDVKRQATDLGELVQSTINMVGHLGRYQGKHIVWHCPKPVVALVNAQEIKQVLLNLLTNALDSLDTDGTVRIELSERGSQAELVLSDNGCGMSDEVLKHLFEPFFTRRRNGGGTGLGLSITFRIISEHGGQIEAASAGPGRGATFRVTLPLAAYEQKESSHRYQAA